MMQICIAISNNRPLFAFKGRTKYDLQVGQGREIKQRNILANLFVDKIRQQTG